MSLHRLCCCNSEADPCCKSFWPLCRRDPALTDAQRRVIFECSFTRSSTHQVNSGTPTVFTSSFGLGPVNFPWTTPPSGWSVADCVIQRALADGTAGANWPKSISENCTNSTVSGSNFAPANQRVFVRAEIGRSYEFSLSPNTSPSFAGLGIDASMELAIDPATGNPAITASAGLGDGGTSWNFDVGTEVIPTLVSADACPPSFRIDIDATRVNVLHPSGSCVVTRTHHITGFARLQVTGVIEC